MIPVDERLMRRTQFGPGCWLWTGGRDSSGYGVIRFKGRAQRAHSCDNTLCVNPAHLFIGSRVDNNHDRHAKGRSAGPRGALHGRARFTEAQVREIRRAHGAGAGISELARRHSRTISCINHIVHRRSWRHI